MDGIGRQLAVVAGLAIQLAQHRFGGTGQFGITDQLELVTSVAHFNAQPLFNEEQVFVKLAAEAGKAA